MQANNAFDIYRDLYVTLSHFAFPLLLTRQRYYEGGVSSVYLWDLDGGFAGVVLLKKSMKT